MNSLIVNLAVVIATLSISTITHATTKMAAVKQTRPEVILKALAEETSVYYMGVGSNILKEKVVNRGKGIAVESFQAARVLNYRLAFNKRGSAQFFTIIYHSLLFLASDDDHI